MVDDEHDDGAARRDRSPNYPSVGFPAALELVRTLYNKEKRHPMSALVAAKHLGYTLNGKSRSRLAALKKYGLLEATTDGVKVTDDAVAMLVYPPNSPEYRRRAETLPLRPEIFREILEQFSGELPSDQNLRARLIADRKFAEDGADGCIANLRESIAFMRDVVPAGPSTEHAEAGVEAGAEPVRASGAKQSQVGQEVEVTQPDAPARGSASHYRLPLGGGVDVELRFSGALGKKQLNMLKKQVDLFADAMSDEVGD